MMIDFDYLWNKYQIKPYGVLHLGANTGQELDTYLKHNVGRVIWVEAIPAVFESLLNHVSDASDLFFADGVNYGYAKSEIDGAVIISYRNQECILACVGEEEGKEVEFNISNNESQSSSYLELGHHKVIHPSVEYIDKFKTKIKRIDNLFTPEQFEGDGDWFLNADLQGSELQAFKGMGDLLHKFKWVYSEVNFQECYVGGALIGELDEYLLKFNFTRMETGPVVGETWTDALYCKA